VIINYESLWRTELLGWNWDTIIFDESHRLQNMRTKLWEGISKNLEIIHEGRVILLSGTPCPEGPHQLITQSIIARGDFDGHTNPWNALRAGWEYNEYNYKWEPKFGTEGKGKAIMHSFGKAMTQAEAGILTKKLHRTITVEATVHEESLYLQCIKDSMEPMAVAQLAQSCASGRDPRTGETVSSTKLDEVANYAIELGKPCVILTHFTASLEYVVRKLTSAGIKCEAIYGEDKLGSAGRAKVIERFNDGRTTVIVASVPTVKVGLNLSHSDTLLFAENNWSGEARIQAEERATVKGKEAVEIIDFACTSNLIGDIDLKIAQAVRSKQDFNVAMLREVKHDVQ
jgi:SNF2 family DNA or RNA helicase